MWTEWAKLATRVAVALERIADAIERAEPEWRREDALQDKTEVLTRGNR